MYCDEIEKLKYLRDRVASTLIASEILPDRIAIDKRLASVDAKLALFQTDAARMGDEFDARSFNEGFMLIYQDLLILYKLVYRYSVEKFNATKAYIDSHLTSLEDYANRYSRKAEFEAGGVATGKTIFFKGSGFSPDVEGFYSSYDLGEVTVNKGSKVTFHIDGRSFDVKDAIFQLGDMRCSAYSVNHDYLTIPGEPSFNLMYYDLPDDVERNATFPMEISDFTPAINNRYIIYGGKGKISHTDGAYERFYEKDKDISISFAQKRGKVSFFVIGATYIDMDFTHKPLSQNFAGNSIPSPEKHQLVTFEYGAENFAMDLNTDGAIYAVRRTGVVKDDKLYYPQADPELFDFRIEEYGSDNADPLKLQVKLKHYYGVEPYVTMIAVKEQSLFDEAVS